MARGSDNRFGFRNILGLFILALAFTPSLVLLVAPVRTPEPTLYSDHPICNDGDTFLDPSGVVASDDAGRPGIRDAPAQHITKARHDVRQGASVTCAR